MKESLTPEKIQKDFLSGDLDKGNAAELIISLIKETDNTNFWIRSIKASEKIKHRSEKISKTLENYMISDENANVDITHSK